MVGSGLGAKNGILIKGGEALETARNVTAIVFDKTGTLTKGHPEVTDSLLFAKNLSESDFYQLIGSAETASEHPLGKAIVRHVKNIQNIPFLEVVDFEAVAGQGLKCTVDGSAILVGNRKWMLTNKLTLTESMESQIVELEEQVGCLLDCH